MLYFSINKIYLNIVEISIIYNIYTITLWFIPGVWLLYENKNVKGVIKCSMKNGPVQIVMKKTMS